MHVKSTHAPALETVNVWEHPSNQSVSVSQDGQKCCFLRLVLHFYVETVFRSYTSSQPQYRHILSSLANTFIIIRKQMHTCVSQLLRETGVEKTKTKHVKQVVVILTFSCVQHCLCEEQTQKRMESLHGAFNKVCARNHYRKTSLYGLRCANSKGAKAPTFFCLRWTIRFQNREQIFL